MHTCPLVDADIVVDGKAYRIETTSELRELGQRLLGKKGIQFPMLDKTKKRLKAEDSARKEAQRVARWQKERKTNARKSPPSDAVRRHAESAPRYE